MSENRLRNETSPYLLQHKDNPVHWWPWGRAALKEANKTGKPILLSVGYSACHWCHVMAHESFEDPDVAEVMNRLFVNVKVDREERPDVDQIYMQALHALGEQGGWPLTMFLTPAGEPVWGGTYFPKTAKFGRPGFITVMEEIARIFKEEPAKIESNRTALVTRISERSRSTADLSVDILDRAALGLLDAMDSIHGGIKGAPKFPNASVLDLLWRAYFRTGDHRFKDAVLLTLRQIAEGGIYDHLGGGFARYSVDERWLVPHFEKMLYDNAQLVSLMTSAWQISGDDLFRHRIEETISWLSREMIAEGSAFSSSIDADSEGEEGRFYVWTLDEITDVLGDDDTTFFAAHYDAATGGNWEGKIILNRLRSNPSDDVDKRARLAALRNKLLLRRSARIPPGRDDKILADWNGLMIAALARAATEFQRQDWLLLAETAYRFIAESMTQDGRFGHSYRSGRLVFPGFASDHANMAHASLALHAATFDDMYLRDAIRTVDVMDSHYADSDTGGYFLTAIDSDDLILRPKNASDEATPNANAVAANVLVRLWSLTGDTVFRDRADAIFTTFSQDIAANVFMTAALLNAFDFRLNPITAIVLGEPANKVASLRGHLQSNPSPNLVLFGCESTDSLDPSHPAFGKTAQDGRETVYLCHGDRCGPPITSADNLADQLRIP